MRSTIYKFELKKLFCSRVNMIALAASAVLLILLVVSSIYEARPVSRKAAGELNGREIDEQLIEEMRPMICCTLLEPAAIEAAGPLIATKEVTFLLF